MNENIAHSGAWGLAAIMIVVASWVLYRYLAPRTWREWASAGVVQAFIIALYAEMYGFPLTIYLLARFFVSGSNQSQRQPLVLVDRAGRDGHAHLDAARLCAVVCRYRNFHTRVSYIGRCSSRAQVTGGSL